MPIPAKATENFCNAGSQSPAPAAPQVAGIWLFAVSALWVKNQALLCDKTPKLSGARIHE